MIRSVRTASEEHLRSQIAGLPLGALRYFPSTGSTNTEALRWAEAGAPHLALVVANEQTAGRGRLGRRWFTPPGSALALSLLLRPQEVLRSAQNEGKGKAQENGDGEIACLALPRLAGLGALAVCAALEQGYSLQPQIKWPNDVLLGGRKVCGVLAELSWQGQSPRAAVLGIGINIAPGSMPPEAVLRFPATCVECEVGQPVDRWALLREVLSALLDWHPRLVTPEFRLAWESRLAYLGDRVQLLSEGRIEAEGRLLGLDPAGSLRLQLPCGEERSFPSGELRLRQTSGRSTS
jgi:BirA family biotin operon repressor/biotin-[acetyl-CoA-carboxylase] ligase